MCGIAGIVGAVSPNAGCASVERMMQTMERRGPDGGGVHQWPGATLGHRRLAIFDLSPLGRQPMLSDDGRIGVVFNGAIYNFRVLRHELEGRGYTFRSETDTEILIAGYREWGIDQLLERVRGMFAFALWDDDSRTLFMARDPLGVKPLAYSFVNGTLAFASTVRALRAGGYGGDLEPGAIAEYLENGYVPESRAIARDVAKLPPATIAEWRGGACVSAGTGLRQSLARPGPTRSIERSRKRRRCCFARSSAGSTPTCRLARCSAEASIRHWSAGRSPDSDATLPPTR